MKHLTADLEGADLDAAVALAEATIDPTYRAKFGSALVWQPHGWDAPRCFVGHSRKTPAEFARMKFRDHDFLVFVFAPSRRWEEGGPIIERERITVQASRAGDWRAWVGDGDSIPAPEGRGDTHLIAAMRAYVAHKLGPEVELP